MRVRIAHQRFFSFLLIAILWLPTACRPVPVADHSHTTMLTDDVAVPHHVRRLAVWYPRTWEQEVTYGYSRLEQAAFQLKKRRADIKILERRNLEQLTDEQHLQLSGRVGDDSVVRVGRWLGADSLVLFRIDGPTWRDRLLARMHGKMPPFVVSSKIISLESGEVLYHDVVTAAPVPHFGEWSDYDSDHQLRPAMQAALDQALSAAILHLHQSFR